MILCTALRKMSLVFSSRKLRQPIIWLCHAILNRFGTDIEIKDNIAVINGVDKLHSANVNATDLRGGAALVVAALCANGESNIYGIEHIDRGYENLENALSSIGADIKRSKNEGETKAKASKKEIE